MSIAKMRRSLGRLCALFIGAIGLFGIVGCAAVVPASESDTKETAEPVASPVSSPLPFEESIGQDYLLDEDRVVYGQLEPEDFTIPGELEDPDILAVVVADRLKNFAQFSSLDVQFATDTAGLPSVQDEATYALEDLSDFYFKVFTVDLEDTDNDFTHYYFYITAVSRSLMLTRMAADYGELTDEELESLDPETVFPREHPVIDILATTDSAKVVSKNRIEFDIELSSEFADSAENYVADYAISNGMGPDDILEDSKFHAVVSRSSLSEPWKITDGHFLTCPAQTWTWC